MAEKKNRVSILTEVIHDDSTAAKLSQRVEELLEDAPRAKVLWFQTPLDEKAPLWPARLTAVVTWQDA